MCERLDAFVEEDTMHEEVLLKHVDGRHVYSKNFTASFVSQTDIRLATIAILDSTPHEDLHYRSRCIAVIDTFGYRQKSATVA